MFFFTMLAALFGQILLGGIAGKLAAKRHNASQRPAGLSEFNLPTADESRAIQLLWGTERIDAPNVLWYGDYSAAPIYKRIQTTPWTTAKVIAGYRYMLGLDLGLCFGKIDQVRELRMDEQVLWSGASGAGLINAYATWQDGDADDGAGAQIEIHDGTQTDPSPYMLARLGAGEVPAYTGLAHVVWKGAGGSTPVANTSPWAAWRVGSPAATGWIGNSPQLRTIDATVSRFPATVNGAGTSIIGGTEANPAECLFELLTAPALVGDTAPWSARLAPEQIDLPSFAAACATLHAEGHGLSALYDTTQAADSMAQEILRYIDGILVPLPSGKLALRLIRAGGTPTLTLNDSAIVRVDSAARAAADEHVNTLEVLFRDRSLADPRATRPARAQDVAGVQYAGGAIVQQVRYDMCRNAALAATLAVRDLRAAAVPALRLTFAARGCEELLPGDVISATYTRLGLSAVPLRVLSVSAPGDHTQEATVDAIEDVFSAGYATYTPPASLADDEPEPAPPSDIMLTLAPPHLHADALADHWMLLVAPPLVGARAYTVYADSAAVATIPDASATPDYIASSSAWSVKGALTGLEFAAGIVGADDVLTVSLAHAAHAKYVPAAGYARVSTIFAGLEYIAYSGVEVSGSVATLRGIKRGCLGTLPLTAAAANVWLMPSAPVVDPAPIRNESWSCVGTATDVGTPIIESWYTTDGAVGVGASRYRVTTTTARGTLPMASAPDIGSALITPLSIVQTSVVPLPTALPLADLELPAGWGACDYDGAVGSETAYAIRGPCASGMLAGNGAPAIPAAITVQAAGAAAPSICYVAWGASDLWAATFDDPEGRIPWAMAVPVVLSDTFTLRWSDRTGAAAPAAYTDGAGSGAEFDVLLKYFGPGPYGGDPLTNEIAQRVTSPEATFTIPAGVAAGPILVSITAVKTSGRPDPAARDGYVTRIEVFPGFPQYGFIEYPAQPLEYNSYLCDTATAFVAIPLTLGVHT